MPTITADSFRKMNLMAGTARMLEQSEPSGEDLEIWERDFALICNDLGKLVDPELAADLRGEKAFYDAALRVAKGYFDKKPFGGMKSATGQFGFRMLSAQDLLEAASDASTPYYYDWHQTFATTSAKTYMQYALGYNSGKVYASNESNKHSILAFHRLLSYKPNPRLIYVEWNVNDYPYAPYCVEMFSKIAKQDKLFKIIPMPGRIIIHPGGGFYAHFYFDREVGVTTPSGVGYIDGEIGPFGLVFGEYDYLASTELT